MTDPAPDHAGLIAELTAWVDANWSVELPLREWWNRLASAGWAFPDWPVEQCGRGLTRTQSNLVGAHLGVLGVLGAPRGAGQMWGAQTIIAHGSDEQRARFLPPLAAGLEAWCQLFSEPDAGSDLASLRTTAEPAGGGRWRVNGQKVWTTRADRAERGLLLARTDPAAPKRTGITYFVIDMQQPGVEARPIVQMDGLARFMQVTMTDAIVEDDCVIGQVHDGWRVARTTLLYERLLSAALRPSGIAALPGTRGGVLDRPVGELVEAERTSARPASYTVSTKSLIELATEHGRLGEHEVRRRLVDHHIATSVHRWNRARSQAATRPDQRTGAEESIAKLNIAELSRLSRDIGLQIMGPAGMLANVGSVLDRRVLEVALSSPSTSIAGGTDEIQRNLIAERVLGLPRETDG